MKKSLNNWLKSALMISAVLGVGSLKAADGPRPLEPAYDVATVTEVSATVTDVRVVAKGKALPGLHLMLQTGGETLDVYIAPAEFVKVFDLNFVKGDHIKVIGSKVQFEGAAVMLTREVTMGKVTMLIRDKKGEPLWKFFLQPPVG